MMEFPVAIPRRSQGDRVRELTPEEVEDLRSDLLALDRELRNLLDASDDAAAPVDLDEPIGRVSRIDAIQQQSMVQANRRATQRRLQQVEAALRRLAEDEYGEPGR
jgi:DnaK suppressor protein